MPKNGDSIATKLGLCSFISSEVLLKISESDSGIEIEKYLEFPNGVSDIALIGSRVYAVSKNKLYSIHSSSKQFKEIDFRNIKKVISNGKKLIVTTNSKIFSYDILTENKKILKNIQIIIFPLITELIKLSFD